MRATFFQAIKLLFGLLGFAGILVGYRGSDYPVQANPTPIFLSTPRIVAEPIEAPSIKVPEPVKAGILEGLRSR